MVATVGVACASVVGYWRYAMSVPEYRPSLLPSHIPNGVLQAQKALMLPTAQRHELWDWAMLAPSGQDVQLPLDEMEQRLHTLRPTLDQVRATLRMEWRPYLLPDGCYGSGPFLDVDGCAIAFAMESRLMRSQGDDSGAMQWAFDMMEMGRKLALVGGDEARMHAAGIHETGLRQAEQTVWRLPCTVIPAALTQARRLRREWPALSETAEREYQETLARQTFVFAAMNRESLSQAWHELMRDYDLDQRSDGGATAIRMLLYPRRWVLAHTDAFFRAQVADLRKPVRQRSVVPLPQDPWSDDLYRAQSMSKNTWRLERMGTDLALLEVALAVRRHFLDHGRYPRRLAEVSRRWLPAIPVDLWEQQITYRLQGGRPIIYSMGPDGKDDGGKASVTLRLTASTCGDLVFGELAPTVKSSFRRQAAPAQQGERR